jgi:hypothetical protein
MPGADEHLHAGTDTTTATASARRYARGDDVTPGDSYAGE